MKINVGINIEQEELGEMRKASGADMNSQAILVLARARLEEIKRERGQVGVIAQGKEAK